MSTPGYNEERIKAIDQRIAELKLIKKKLLEMREQHLKENATSL